MGYESWHTTSSKLFVALAAAFALGCATPADVDLRYRPSENLLEVIAVLRQHIPDDTYRFPPARDYSERNVYRSSLLRLENIERVHSESLRAGHWDHVIAFAKGRALERLRAFDLAVQHYRRAAERESPLQEQALRSAKFCEKLEAAARLGYDAEGTHSDPAAGEATSASEDTRAHGILEASEKRASLLEALLEEVGNTHYAAIVREEIERTDLMRARYFTASRKFSSEGNLLAVSELQRVATRHRDSKHKNRHLLALADLYAELASEYVDEHPPESLLFDPATFQELVDSASRLYEAVANQDGTVEKLEAARRLEAFLAFTLRVDRDRFSP